MKFPALFCSLCVLLATAIAFTAISSQAETRCPGNVAGIRPRLVANALLVIPVKINQSGPFDFMVDTGSQLNVIDPGLAAQLNLKSQGTVGVVATAAYSRASVAILDSLEAGSQMVVKPLVIVQDLGPIQAADPRIRGVLGENFLAHFDVLIDYARGLLCLDEANLMEKFLLGERIPLVTSKHPETDLPFSRTPRRFSQSLRHRNPPDPAPGRLRQRWRDSVCRQQGIGRAATQASQASGTRGKRCAQGVRCSASAGHEAW